jgi:hypothetical protein
LFLFGGGVVPKATCEFPGVAGNHIAGIRRERHAVWLRKISITEPQREKRNEANGENEYRAAQIGEHSGNILKLGIIRLIDLGNQWDGKMAFAALLLAGQVRALATFAILSHIRLNSEGRRGAG